MFKTGRIRGAAVAALTLASLSLLTACSLTAGDGAKSDGISIAYLQFTNSGDFPSAIQRGAESVVKPDGGSVTFFNANFDPQAQITQCEDAVTSGRFDAIILAAVDPATGVPCVAAAKEAGIPVATVQTGVGEKPYSLTPQVDGVVAIAGAPIEDQIAIEGELLTKACGTADPCEVISEIAFPTDTFTNDLTNGVNDEFGPKISIVQSIISGYDPGEVAKQLPDALSVNPNVSVFMAVSDSSALAAASVLADEGLSDKIKVVGLGGSAEGAAAVADGTIFGTTGKWPFQYGVFLATELSKAAAGDEVTEPSLNMAKADTPAVITKDNVSQFTPEWGAGTK